MPGNLDFMALAHLVQESSADALAPGGLAEQLRRPSWRLRRLQHCLGSLLRGTMGGRALEYRLSSDEHTTTQPQGDHGRAGAGVQAAE